MKTIVLTFIFNIFVGTFLYSQNKIEGKVTDTKGQPIEGVNIFVLTNQTGTISDAKGSYTITKLPEKKTIKVQYSFIGYKTLLKTIVLNNKTQTINIEMEPTVLQSEEVVVSGGTYSTQHENAITIESISPKKILSGGLPSMIGTLVSRPGLDMIAKSPGVATPVIRGLSMTNILVLNNGVKLENYQFSENHPFIIDEYGIDKIEIIKGPASILYGSEAVGGIINFVKEKPATFNSISGDFHQQYHSNTQGLVSNFGIKGNRNNILWGLRAGIKLHKDYCAGNNQIVPNSRFNEKSAKASIGIIRPLGSFKLFYDYNHDQLGMTLPPALSLVTSNEWRNKYWYQNLQNHILSARNKLFIGQQQMDINAAYQNNHRQLITSPQMPADTMVDLTLQTFSYDLKTNLSNRENTNIILGIQGDFQQTNNGNAPVHIVPDASVSDIGFVGLIQNKILPKLNFQGGVRYDIRKVDISEQSYNTDSTIAFPINKQYQNISFSIGITYNINDLWLIRMNVASAFRSPNLAELTQNGLHSLRYEIGNPNMTPQRNYEADLGFHFHNKNFSATLSPFYNRINNYIYLSPTLDSAYLPPDSTKYRIYRYQQANATIYGGEISANYALKFLQVSSSYSYLVGQQDDGNYLPYIPQNKIRGNVKISGNKWHFLTKPYFSLDLLYAQEKESISIYETPTNDYFLLNMSIGSKINIKKTPINWSVSINNLLDTAYYDHLSTLKDLNFFNMGRNISIYLDIPF